MDTPDPQSSTTTPTIAELYPRPRRRDEGMQTQIERLATVFESSARRWEMMVYPSLFAFIILAGYGFYLIFNLTRDVASLARNVNSLTETIETSLVDNMGSMTADMSAMRTHIGSMSLDMGQMSQNLGSISTGMETITQEMEHLGPMRLTMAELNKNTEGMVASTNSIRHEMGAMNYSIGRPISQISSFFPW